MEPVVDTEELARLGYTVVCVSSLQPRLIAPLPARCEG